MITRHFFNFPFLLVATVLRTWSISLTWRAAKLSEKYNTDIYHRILCLHIQAQSTITVTVGSLRLGHKKKTTTWKILKYFGTEEKGWFVSDPIQGAHSISHWLQLEKRTLKLQIWHATHNHHQQTHYCSSTAHANVVLQVVFLFVYIFWTPHCISFIVLKIVLYDCFYWVFFFF